jgi:hypothetical protein
MADGTIALCSVNGIVGHSYIKRGRKIRKIAAICGSIKCAGNQCSLPIGECEHQVKQEN